MSAMPEPSNLRTGDWRDSAAVQAAVQTLLESMTVEEKIDLVTGDLNHGFGFYNAPIDRLGVPPLAMADGPPGVRINKGEVHGGKATALPAPIALAATWNADLARRYGHVLGHEARASGHNVFLGPAVDIARVPVGGRQFESAGEDPLLSARMACAQIDAIQSHQVLACLKHYAVNNQEYERSSVDVEVDERTLREIYLRPFEIVCQATGVASVMGAFNRINGTYACEHHALLKTVLRDEWGFRGWVMSDYGATHSTVPSALAGLDQEQPSGVFYADALRRAVEGGDVPLATLNEMCARILRTVIGLGVFDRPLEVSDMQGAEHREVARAIAEQAVVLLKNDDTLLPLHPQGMRRVVVIGCDADSVAAAGGGSGKIRPSAEVSLLEGIRQRLGAEVQVDYCQGNDPVSAADLLPGSDSIPSCFLRADHESGTPGLRAEFWTNPDFFGDAFTSCVMPQAALNLGFFNFPGFGAASPKFPALPFELTGRTSVRFSGHIAVPVEGTYRLSVTLLGSAKIWLDDQLVLDFRYHGPGRSGGGGGAASGGWAGFGADDDVRVAHVGDEARALAQRAADVGLNATALPVPLALPLTAASGGAGGPSPDVTSIGLHLGKHRAGHRLRIDYAADAPAQGHLTGAQFRLGWVPPPGVVSRHIEDAVAHARGADLAVLAVRCYESEHMDRPDLQLPNGQAALIRAVAAVNPNTVVVTMSGGPVETLSWEQDVRAILHAWYLGQEQGTALAALLFGDVVPSGKLPLTFPRSDAEGVIRSAAQYPGIAGRVVYEEGTQVGYRGFDAQDLPPRFAFGHGLSYTSFGYADLQITSGDDSVSVAFTVANTGGRAGMETAQLYVGLNADGAAPRQLIDWQKVALEPGERRRIAFHIDPRSIEHPFSTWCDGRWQLARGLAALYVGASSCDIRLHGEVAI